MIGRSGCACGVALVICFGSASAAVAQIASAAPAGGPYGPLGVPLGGFLLFPSITVTTVFDDNIRRSPTNKLSDVFFSFRPTVALRSQWPRHALNLTATSDSLVYSKYSSENVTNFGFTADGRLDVLNSLRINAATSYERTHLPRSSPELPSNAEKPLPFNLWRADVSVAHQPAQFGVEVGVLFDRFRYDSVETIAGPDISWQDQNRDIIVPRARVFYEFSPGYSAYVEGRGEKRNFELPVDRYGFDRSSRGYRVRGGFAAELGNLIQGDAFIGYLNQEYEAPLEDISGLDFGASLNWSVTALTTLHLSAARLVNDSAFQGVSASDDQLVALSVDHALLQNFVLHGNVGFMHSDFRGSSRADQVADFGFGAEYFMNRNLSVAARYSYQHRTTDVPAQGYSDNLFSIALRGQL